MKNAVSGAVSFVSTSGVIDLCNKINQFAIDHQVGEIRQFSYVYDNRQLIYTAIVIYS